MTNGYMMEYRDTVDPRENNPSVRTFNDTFTELVIDPPRATIVLGQKAAVLGFFRLLRSFEIDCMCCQGMMIVGFVPLAMRMFGLMDGEGIDLVKTGSSI